MTAPTTQWIRDDGTVLVDSESTSLLVDESGDFFVDEGGDFLQDSQSSDGLNPVTVWSADEY